MLDILYKHRSIRKYKPVKGFKENSGGFRPGYETGATPVNIQELQGHFSPLKLQGVIVALITGKTPLSKTGSNRLKSASGVTRTSDLKKLML